MQAGFAFWRDQQLAAILWPARQRALLLSLIASISTLMQIED
jgi:hypothetical protein